MGLMSPLLSALVTSDEVPGPLAAGTLMRTDGLFAFSFPAFRTRPCSHASVEPAAAPGLCVM